MVYGFPACAVVFVFSPTPGVVVALTAEVSEEVAAVLFGVPLMRGNFSGMNPLIAIGILTENSILPAGSGLRLSRETLGMYVLYGFILYASSC